MKRHKLYLLFAIIVGIMFAPFFAGCGEEIKITLKQPDSFGYEVNQETGEQMLVVEENPFATSYVFGICATRYESDLSNFLRYEFPAKYTTTYQGQEVEIPHNFFDVTNIFKNAQTYYYYVQYKGQGKYLNSPISEIKSVSITHKLESPFLSINEEDNKVILSWTGINNASTYSVYSIIDGKRESVGSTQETTYDISEYMARKIEQNLSSEVKFFVYCNNTQNYLRSADSNNVVYRNHLQLAVPSNVQISKVSGQDYLCWNIVNNCTSYTIKVNNLKTEVLQLSDLTKSGREYTYCIEKYYDEYGLGDYTFCVKANNSGNFTESAYSASISTTITKQLDTPQNLRCIVDSSTVDIMWDIVENAHEYELEFTDITDNNQIKKFVMNSGSGIESPIIRNSVTLTYEQLHISTGLELQSNSFIIRVKAVGYNYYLTSEPSVGKSVISKYQTLNAPVLQDDADNCLIYWSAVLGAKNYRMHILHGLDAITINVSNTSFDYSAYLTEVGTYQFTCIAVAYDEAYNSAYSNCIEKEKMAPLSRPTINNISIEDNKLVIDFSGDPNAQNYSLYANNHLITNNLTIDENEIDIISVIEYKNNSTIDFYIIANGYDLYDDSQQSNLYVLNTELSQPIISSISVDGDKLVINFSVVENANTYSLYANNNLITDALTSLDNRIDITSAMVYKQNSKIDFYIIANGHDLYSDSKQSNKFVFSTKLSTPSAQLSNNTLSWNSVANATSYSLFLDDEMQELNSTATSINLDNYVSQNTARQVRIIANNLYLDSSDASSASIYNNASRNLTNFTDKYFYYGQTYDYYITSEQELKDVVLYAYYNLLPTLTIYIDYDSSTTIYNKLVEVGPDNTKHMRYITGTYNFNPSISNNNSATGQTTITFNHKSISAEPNYTASTTQATSYMALTGDGSRQANYKFAVENSLVSQDVYTTDGLLSAVQNQAKPHFMTSNSTAEQVYNVAKDILIEICDDSMTDYEKALAIHDWICLNVSYDTEGLNSVSINNYLGYFHFIESALLYNLGVCDAYSKTFALLCSLENVECIVVDGSTDKNDREHTGHAWNKIHIDIDGDDQKEWFAIDCTWDDATSGTEEYLKHQYFMIPDSYLADRYEDGDYPTAEYGEYDSFYSFYTPYGLKIIVETQSDVNAVNTFVSSNPTKKIELLVKTNMVSRLSIGTYYQWYYAHDGAFRVIIKK